MKLIGSYSSKQIPLIIQVFLENNVLIIQATGQPKISLDAIEKNNTIHMFAVVNDFRACIWKR